MSFYPFKMIDWTGVLLDSISVKCLWPAAQRGTESLDGGTQRPVTAFMEYDSR